MTDAGVLDFFIFWFNYNMVLGRVRETVDPSSFRKVLGYYGLDNRGRCDFAP